MLIRVAGKTDIQAIHHLAYEIWWPSYKGILSEEQIEFMLEDIYSAASLEKQMQEGATFIIAEEDGKALGFASFSSAEHLFKIHKLYILPSHQGKKLGSQLLNFIEDEAKKHYAKFLELNVNRNNLALSFYQKVGFEIFEEVDIPYHQFLLNDYVMRREIRY